MKLKELLKGVSIKESLGVDMALDVKAISDDSRIVNQGSLFIAIEGFESDGHDYIDMAIKKGAQAIVCERSVDVNVPVIVVENGRQARAQIAINYYENPSKAFKVIGVTGTNGKTSVSTMLADLLNAMGMTVATLGTNGNFIAGEKLAASRTTPDAIELQNLFSKMKGAGVTHCLMEVSSHALALDRVYGVAFELGIFTNLTEDHLDFHPTMADYFEAKAKLFQLCKKGLANTDDPYGRKLIETHAHVKGFGRESETDYLIDLKEKRGKSTVLILDGIPIEYQQPGMIYLYNMSTVLLAALNLGFDWEEILSKMTDVRPVEGRMEVFGEDVQVVVDYAHTPDALEKIIGDVRSFTKGRVITVFGCGGDRDPYKRSEMGKIATCKSDAVIITNDNPRTEDPKKILDDILKGVVGQGYLVELDRARAIEMAIEMAGFEDSVIVAGKGHETYQIIGSEKIDFDDRKIVKKALKEK